MNCAARHLLAAVALVLTARTLAAQTPTAPAPTRDQLAVAYLRLEYALRDHPPTAATLAEVNRAADRAGMAFLGGRGALALHVLDSLAAALEADPTAGRAARRAAEEALAAAPRRTRQVMVGADSIAYQVHAPSAAREALPVLIALHGAGGDERMFMEGNGAGRLRALADERGFLAVTPFTNHFMRSPEVLDALLDTLAAAHPIDRTRIWLLGHSLGAIAAWRVALARPAAIAAVVCVAGPCGGAPPDTSARWRAMPPTLVIAGALDPIAAPGRLEQSAAAARAAGVPIEFRVLPDLGHTFVIGYALPDAVTWLLAQPPRTR
jgi:predicted esterase